jgi:hypothetical protein
MLKVIQGLESVNLLTRFALIRSGGERVYRLFRSAAEAARSSAGGGGGEAAYSRR